MSSTVVFDIETIGLDFDKDFDEVQKDYLLKFATSDEEKVAIKEGLGLYPVSGQIVCIALYNVDSGRGVVYFDSNSKTRKNTESDGVKFIDCDEKTMLEKFWEDIKSFDRYVTFNGRCFDAPFVRIRSAILGVKASRMLATPRFKNEVHFDLLEELTFQGAMKKFNLDFYCKAFGIKSPKQSVSGHEVPKLYAAKKGLEIAEYCYGDVVATGELYKKWIESASLKY